MAAELSTSCHNPYVMKTFIVLSLTLMSFFTAHSQTAGNWPLNSNLNGAAGASLAVSAVSPGSAIPSSAFNSGSEWYGEGGWPSGAIDPNAYVEFTLTASAGHYLVLNTVTLIQRRSNTGSPQGAGPNKYSLRSSLDNYSTDIATGALDINYATYTINLPSAFQAIPSKVTFRIYGYNTTINSGGISRMVFDNISVQGQSVSGVLASQSIHLSAAADAEKKVTLEWDAAGFDQATAFAIQRSSDAAGFVAVHQIKGETSFVDEEAPAGTLYYRIEATLPDGSHYFSSIVSVRLEDRGRTKIKAVIPQGGAIRTLLHLQSPDQCRINIWSLDGKAVAEKIIGGQTGDVQSDIVFNYPHGVYILTIAGAGGASSCKFVY